MGKGEIAHYEQFFFSDSVFKRLVLQTRKNQGLLGKGLICSHKKNPTTHVFHNLAEENFDHILTNPNFSQPLAYSPLKHCSTSRKCRGPSTSCLQKVSIGTNLKFCTWLRVNYDFTELIYCLVVAKICKDQQKEKHISYFKGLVVCGSSQKEEHISYFRGLMVCGSICFRDVPIHVDNETMLTI